MLIKYYVTMNHTYIFLSGVESRVKVAKYRALFYNIITTHFETLSIIYNLFTPTAEYEQPKLQIIHK